MSVTATLRALQVSSRRPSASKTRPVMPDANQKALLETLGGHGTMSAEAVAAEIDQQWAWRKHHVMRLPTSDMVSAAAAVCVRVNYVLM